MKKVRLQLKVMLGERYSVVKVTNSIEWTPGAVLTRAEVKGLMNRPALDVVITE